MYSRSAPIVVVPALCDLFTEMFGDTGGVMPVMAVEQLLPSFDSTIASSGSTHASLSIVPPSWVMKTLMVIVTSSNASASFAVRSPMHLMPLTGFSVSSHRKLAVDVVTPSGMRPIGSGSTTTTSWTAAPSFFTVRT